MPRKAVFLLLAAIGCLATDAAWAREMAADGPLKTQYLKTGLYMITGGGSNSLMRLTANGVILVDGKLPANYDSLRKQMRRISDLPVRIVITTDQHEARTGTNARFAADGAAVVAHVNVSKNVSPGNGASAPTQTYDQDFTGRLGGTDIRLMHFGNAHTNGDSVVYFPGLKVVALGDLYAATPDPDYADGGSLVGWSQVLAEVLKLDFDVAVPGSGPTVRRSDVQALKQKIDKLVSDAGEMVRDGVPKNKLMAQLETDDLDWRFGFTNDQVDRFYAELMAAN